MEIIIFRDSKVIEGTGCIIKELAIYIITVAESIGKGDLHLFEEIRYDFDIIFTSKR